MGNTPKPTFGKTALSPQALLAKLKMQGLIVDDDELAIKYISYVGHFRLKGYWFQLQPQSTRNFLPGTTFNDIVLRYECDREIRAIILESVERLEVAVRTTICNLLSLKYSPHWYFNTAIFAPKRRFGIGQMLSKIESEIERSRAKNFINAYYDKHDDPYLPPSWAMSECVTINMWSNIFAMLREPVDRKAISSKFGINQVEVFESWLHALTVLLNMAAHHDRFIDTKLGVGPTNHKQRNIKFGDNKTIYAALTMIHILLESIKFNGTFKQRLINIEEKYGAGLFQIMGFPRDWKTAAVGW